MNKDFVDFRRGNNCDCQIISIDEWNETLDEIKSKYDKAEFSSTKVHRIAKWAGCYDILTTQSFKEIRVIDWDKCQRIRVYFNGSVQQHKEQPNNIGMEALKEIQQMAAKYNGRYYSMKLIFSFGREAVKEVNRIRMKSKRKGIPLDSEKVKEDLAELRRKNREAVRDAYRHIKDCVISPFDFAYDAVIGKVINVNKADKTAAYPSEFQGKLPTLENHKVVQGRAKPTEEYPFAFYINSHHLAIYGEFDSRDFLDTPFYNRIIYGHKWLPIDTPDSKEITILCKEENCYSKGFKLAFQEMYARRKDEPSFKLKMNACIGMLHLNSDPNCSHIAAAIYGRCVKDMLDKCKIIQDNGGIVVLVNTDSISWIGPVPLGLCTDKKRMGAFHLEGTNIKMIIKGVKCYQFMQNGEVITRFAGIPKEISSKLGFGDIMMYNGSGVAHIRELPDDKLEVRLK